MTTNQIAYQRNLLTNRQLAEEERANRVREKETERANKMKELLGHKELSEKFRHNLSSEMIQTADVGSKYAKVLTSIL